MYFMNFMNFAFIFTFFLLECKKIYHSSLQGRNPPFLREPSLQSNLKSYLTLSESHPICACKLYETLENEGVTFCIILSQLIISLSLLYPFRLNSVFTTDPFFRY